MEEEIGKVTHYYTKLGVAIVDLSAPLTVGDKIHIKGHTTDFTQSADSLEIEHESVQAAKAGDVIGLKVTEHARETDVVFKVT